MIEATAYHIKPDEKFSLLMRNTAVRWILDADLIRFLDPEWQKWADGIRHEYAEHPDEKFNAGRKHILEQFAKLDPFFFSLDHEANETARALVQEQLDALD
jgi:predicted metal-dependent HD superfamily phosphohydrolase